MRDIPRSSPEDLRQIRGSQQASGTLVQVNDLEFAFSFLRIDPQPEERTYAGAVQVLYIRKVQHDAFGLSDERLNRVQDQRRGIRIDSSSAKDSYFLRRLARVELQIVNQNCGSSNHGTPLPLAASHVPTCAPLFLLVLLVVE